MCGYSPKDTVSGKVEEVRASAGEMRPLWKKFLLNQFHDVLPGSCIEQVAKDALQIYEGATLYIIMTCV